MSRKRRHEDAEEDVFMYYEHTESTSIPKDITSLRIHSSVKKIPYQAFLGLHRLVHVEYNEGLEVIGEKAFTNCHMLREQQFPSTLIEIGRYAFLGCHALESVGRLPQNLQIIRFCAFGNCWSLNLFEITNDTIRLERALFENCRRLCHFRLPPGMVTIPDSLFISCVSLAGVDVPLSVVHIGNRAFRSCENLSMTQFPVTLKTIGCWAFHATGLQSFHSPPKIECISKDSFSECRNLASVILPPKLKVIKEKSFYSCNRLRHIDIPQSVVQIEKRAFAKCLRLKEVILPKTGLKRIEERTFEGCYSLTHLWVPPSVEYIDSAALGDCASLLSVEVPETLKRLVLVGARTFEDGLCGYGSLVNIYIPPSYQLEDVNEEEDFMEYMRLGEAESSYPDLVDKLKHRFDSLPLHRACYFHSYHSVEDNLETIRQIARTQGPRAFEELDFLGMTPLHILALAQRPQVKVLEELLSSSRMDVWKPIDVFGSSPLYYMCKNHSAVVMAMTKSMLDDIIKPRVSHLGLDDWKEEIRSELEELKTADSYSLIPKVTSVCETLERMERMEVLSLLEVSVWRMRVEEETAIGSGDRERCRINCGSSIVLEHVIPFLEAPMNTDDT